MKEIRVPSDVIKFILCYLGSGTRFTADMLKIHSAFYALSQDASLAVLFKEFVFDESRVYPYTQTVRYAFDRLQKSDLLVMIGLEQFEVSKTLAKVNPRLLFNKDEIVLLKRASEKFCNVLQGSQS